MKKILAGLMAVVLVLTMVACSSGAISISGKYDLILAGVTAGSIEFTDGKYEQFMPDGSSIGTGTFTVNGTVFKMTSDIDSSVVTGTISENGAEVALKDELSGMEFSMKKA